MAISKRCKRPSVTPTNSLILLLPALLFSQDLLPLFEAHFMSYGEMVSWTSLERLGRILVIYEHVEDAASARREMDGFVWDDEEWSEERQSGSLSKPSTAEVEDFKAAVGVGNHRRDAREPMRAFFGPQISLPLPSRHSTLLAVPALSRNFLISPPGSPPVGWEQTLEEAPNRKALPEHPETGSAGWEDELARALRFLSVTSGCDEDSQSLTSEDPVVTSWDDSAFFNASNDTRAPTTELVVPPAVSGQSKSRPAVTVTTPIEGDIGFGALCTPPGAARITSVKATIESMLVRKRSFDHLQEEPSSESSYERRMVPTARPP